ncbi:MAG: RnfABCDGE type electron transport complex subunit B [Eubacterium sp.]|nr:RnfABCDGE type electron transport complex subunit B [Eubacterium sp.]
MTTIVIISTVVVAGCGCVIGLFLSFASKKFEVEVDPKEEAVLEALPGNNCGGCGFPGCSGLAAAIAKGEAPVNQCPVGGEPVAEIISGIMGVSADAAEKKVAFVNCAGNCEKAKDKYEYHGIHDCAMVANVPGGGPKTCSYGCLGFGNCVKACPFDAIHIVNGIAHVDHEACKACGKCVDACPRHIIDLVPYKQKWTVTCVSSDKGKDVMGACDVGCIGCKKCEKECKFDAIHVEGNVAKIDYEKCKNCGMCAKVCPRGIITKTEVPRPVKKAVGA